MGWEITKSYQKNILGVKLQGSSNWDQEDGRIMKTRDDRKINKQRQVISDTRRRQNTKRAKGEKVQAATLVDAQTRPINKSLSPNLKLER